MAGRRLVSVFLSIALVLVVLAPAAATAQTSSPHRAAAGVTSLLTLTRTVDARGAADLTARVVAVVPRLTPLTHSRMTLPVIGTAKSGRWLRVRLPMRPDGSTGWVPASAGIAGSTAWKIVVHRSQRRAVVFKHGRTDAAFPVVVGKPSTPTPTGTFFVVEKLHLAPGVAEGPWALATSAYSNVLTQFGGGPGQVGLHGTTGLPGAPGTFSSHGCVRFAPAAITWIATRVGAGTPVIITP